MKMHIKALAVAAMTAVASLAATAAPLDTLAGSFNWKLDGTTSEYSPVQYGADTLTTLKETTWGIGEITEIRKTAGGTAWSHLAGGDYLYFMLYGIADLQVTALTPTSFNIFNVGCTGGLGCDGKIHIDIYRMSSEIPDILLQDPDGRYAFNGFTGLTDALGASLYLGLELVPGKVAVDDLATAVDETTATLFQNANANTLPTTGAGTFFAEATSGSAMAQWNTNGFALPGGLFADFDGNFTLKPNLVAAGGACPDGSLPSQCFLGLINDPVQSNAIPEPGSLALVGLALAAFGVIRRRDNKK